ncbi:TIGR00251 family protein [Candidatus Methanoperedens nitroreducens]|uniref:UPF0235 protein ANME2D_00529 n=1 Tax=Candidatus Methanoperedens nitratireducens TaxID=1392998 RepID=A0A062V330_9EURY|nr:DUF167 domain-containing protein [Candidatus Methanoperedens nitroreducens]KCZ73461.1 TIGR00251 family protein [Candidatus Methanoperedens nitroreducens]MDJ1422583.1 DUF167 domain-containing protein [Candidatus Methanoperedens sp.]
MKDAVKQVRDGVILDLEISPGAKETDVSGYNPWRKRIEIRLSERAEKGRANDQLISFLSGLLNVSSRNIQIVAGLTSSRKSVKIIGVRAQEILKVLTER